jgi:hypothetical protein
MASKANNGGSGRHIPWRILGWGAVAILILLPLVAMQFSSEVNWTASDFIFAAAMFGIAGGTFELAVRASGSRAYRAGAAIALLTAFLTIWINLAVGIIGNEGNPLNLMFFGVIAAAIVGAIVARFEAAGMARAMTVAAALQGFIGVGVLVTGWGSSEPPGIFGLFILIEFFSVAWLLSALCFRKSAAA